MYMIYSWDLAHKYRIQLCAIYFGCQLSQPPGAQRPSCQASAQRGRGILVGCFGMKGSLRNFGSP